MASGFQLGHRRAYGLRGRHIELDPGCGRGHVGRPRVGPENRLGRLAQRPLGEVPDAVESVTHEVVGALLSQGDPERVSPEGATGTYIPHDGAEPRDELHFQGSDNRALVSDLGAPEVQLLLFLAVHQVVVELRDAGLPELGKTLAVRGGRADDRELVGDLV